MVNNSQRIDRLEGEIRAIPHLISSEMDRIRSELNLTTQNLSSQINTINQNHNSLSTEMTTLSQTIQILSDKLTNPDILNPLIQAHPNTSAQNTPHHEFLNSDGEPISQENSGEERGNWRNKKLDLPVFVGDDPDGWILQAERYFTFYSLSEKEKVESAIVNLEEAALQWFHWEHQRRPIRRWEELKGLVLRRFRTNEEGTLHEQWMRVEQIGTVAEHNMAFVEKANPLGEIPENFLMGTYFKG